MDAATKTVPQMFCVSLLNVQKHFKYKLNTFFMFSVTDSPDTDYSCTGSTLHDVRRVCCCRDEHDSKSSMSNVNKSE